MIFESIHLFFSAVASLSNGGDRELLRLHVGKPVEACAYSGPLEAVQMKLINVFIFLLFTPFYDDYNSLY